MARIYGEAATLYRLERWLGLNENPDGDTQLKQGESPKMRNFRVTRDGHLQIRPGTRTLLAPEAWNGMPVLGVWVGRVGGVEVCLCVCGGHVWSVSDGWEVADLGAVEADGACTFFGYTEKAYLLTGLAYYVWDGTGEFVSVEGYAPIVAHVTPPEGGGELLERVNLLTGVKRQKFSPDGSATSFYLVEREIDAVLSVADGSGNPMAYTADSNDLTAGRVRFASAPAVGVDSITVTWRKGDGIRGDVTSMRYYEFYNGGNDTRVFLYGDGTNRTIYSDLDEHGNPTAEYFPDLNVMHVDSANTPVTGLLRHYDRMLAFKSDGAFSIAYSPLTLVDGTVTAGFFSSPLQREIGSGAVGQLCLVNNAPRTLFGRGIYEWRLASGAVRDERNAKRISDRVEATLSGFDITKTTLFDDEQRQEMYAACQGKVLVHNYGNDTWYYYENIPSSHFFVRGGELYFTTDDGRICHLSRNYRNDDGVAIDAWWESGSLSFGRDWGRKTSSDLWVVMKPENQSRLTVTAQSDLQSVYVRETVSVGMATFSQMDFARFSFRTNRKPQSSRHHIRVRRFVFHKLVFESNDKAATATVLGVDIHVRGMGKTMRGGA